MLQNFATNTAGNPQIKMLDIETGATSLMDYAHGAEAFERHPERWRPADMSEADHAAHLAARRG
jgi:hypothetical protein